MRFALALLVHLRVPWYRDSARRSLSMLEFSHPLYLLLFLLLPPLLWWWWHKRRQAVRHPAAHLLAALPAPRARLARLASLVLRGLGLFALILALAGPRWPDLRTPITTEGIAILVVVDVSGSMAERDFDSEGLPISRLEAVKTAFRLFVEGGEQDGQTFEGRPTDLIGLVCFATRPEPTCPLTLSHTALLRLLDAEQPRSTPGESETNLSDAITLGLHKLQAAGPRRKVLILLTDGEHNHANPRSQWSPRQAAQIAAGLDVPIYTIDAGPVAVGASPPPGATEVRDSAAKTLREIADLTRGQYLPASDTKALLNAVRTIDRQEKLPIRSYQYRRYHQGYPWLCLGGFVFFVTALVLERTLWRRLP